MSDGAASAVAPRQMSACASHTARTRCRAPLTSAISATRKVSQRAALDAVAPDSIVAATTPVIPARRATSLMSTRGGVGTGPQARHHHQSERDDEHEEPEGDRRGQRPTCELVLQLDQFERGIDVRVGRPLRVEPAAGIPEAETSQTSTRAAPPCGSDPGGEAPGSTSIVGVTHQRATPLTTHSDDHVRHHPPGRTRVEAERTG